MFVLLSGKADESHTGGRALDNGCMVGEIDYPDGSGL